MLRKKKTMYQTATLARILLFASLLFELNIQYTVPLLIRNLFYPLLSIRAHIHNQNDIRFFFYNYEFGFLLAARLTELNP